MQLVGIRPALTTSLSSNEKSCQRRDKDAYSSPNVLQNLRTILNRPLQRVVQDRTPPDANPGGRPCKSPDCKLLKTLAGVRREGQCRRFCSCKFLPNPQVSTSGWVRGIDFKRLTWGGDPGPEPVFAAC